MKSSKRVTNNEVEILIVEDSPTQAEQLKYVLERRGYRVFTAENGRKALQYVRERKPTLLITDILMPEMDGYELCRQIKSNESLKDTPVILLTSLSDPADIIRGLLCAADNFIVKPYDEKYLLSRIDYILVNRELRKEQHTDVGVEIYFAGQRHSITSDRLQILDLLFSTYETAVQKNLELMKAQEQLVQLNEELEKKVDERTAALRAEIAERTRAQEQIRQQAALLDLVPDAVFVEDLEDRILSWSKGAERIYGWSADEVSGRKVIQLLFKEAIAQFHEAKQKVIHEGEWGGELNQVTRDGREIVVEGRWRLMGDARGKPSSIFVVNTDVTEKKKIEAQFYRAQRMESIGTLASGIAHDLNNILAPIIMSIDILKNKVADEQGRRVISTIESSARRGSDIVKQVLTFARGVEGEKGVIQPTHLIREMEKVINEIFPKSVHLKINYPRDLWTIIGDVTQLHQVLMNLCVNARDAMPDGGKLTIEAENVLLDENYARMHFEAKPGPHVLVSVSDTGTGIPAGIIDKIFEPFFTTKTPTKGTGLGLATVSALVKSHGGFVNVYSESGRGTTFKIHLPAAKTAETKQAEEQRAPLPQGNGELILVVDDEESIRDIAKETLEMYGYRVVTASDGTEGVAVYANQKGQIHVVLIDMMMPYMDGPTTIRALQRLDPSTRIIVMSGAASDRTATETSHLRISATLRKPFTSEQLLIALHDVLSGR